MCIVGNLVFRYERVLRCVLCVFRHVRVLRCVLCVFRQVRVLRCVFMCVSSRACFAMCVRAEQL